MAKDVSGRRSFTYVAAGAAVIVWGVAGSAGPAAANGVDDLDDLLPGDLGCLDVSAGAGLDAGLDELEITDLPPDGVATAFVLGGGESGDATVSVTVNGNSVAWQADTGVDAVLVTGSGGGSEVVGAADGATESDVVAGALGAVDSDVVAGALGAVEPDVEDGAGGDAEAGAAVGTGVYAYAAAGAGEETSGQIDVGALGSAFLSLSFCHDGSEDSPPVTEPVTTATTVEPSTTVPASSQGELPRTGSTTTPLVVAGAGLLAAGAALVAGKRYLLRSS